MRVFKLAQTWSTMRALLSIVLKTLGALGNLSLILLIVIYIFAVIGMQLFSTAYTEENFVGPGYRTELPRFVGTSYSIHTLLKDAESRTM